MLPHGKENFKKSKWKGQENAEIDGKDCVRLDNKVLFCDVQCMDKPIFL